jgi:demethylmenaquinone methyltransferase/2-methoxy-6-polyprenyl-1,4-benzoquinol methylase
MAILDLRLPDRTPRRLAQVGISAEWIARRPWETIRGAVERELSDVSWTDLFFGTAFLASGRTR